MESQQFRSSTTNSSNDSSDAINSDFNVDGDSGPSPFEDDTELDRQLAIEQDIRAEQKRGRQLANFEDDTGLNKQLAAEQDIRAELEREQQLANFGMPLRMEPGVSTTHR